jgi:hypothetical protein
MTGLLSTALFLGISFRGDTNPATAEFRVFLGLLEPGGSIFVS